MLFVAQVGQLNLSKEFCQTFQNFRAKVLVGKNCFHLQWTSCAWVEIGQFYDDVIDWQLLD